MFNEADSIVSTVRANQLRRSLRNSVRRALRSRRAQLSAAIVAAGFAGVGPLAQGAPFPAVFPLASLFPENGGDGSGGFVLPGIEQEFAGSGFSVSAAGDVNGDGAGDVIVAAFGADPGGGETGTGESYVVFGSTQGFPAVIPLATLLPDGGGDGSVGFVLTGIDGLDYSGHSVSAAGDVNGDGIDDVIIGAPGVPAGESYVVFGTTQDFPPLFPLASLLPDGGGDGTRGFAIEGVDADAGYSVSGAGDVNGDGVDDVIIGAPQDKVNGHTNAGRSYVVFGSTQGFPAVFPLASLFPAAGGNGTRGVVFSAFATSDNVGVSVSAAGDVNGDGTDDLIIGARFADPAGRSAAGESYVVFGTGDFPALFPLAMLYPRGGGDGTRGFVLAGIDEDDLSGKSVSAAGDINGDGIGDVIVGAWLAGHGADAYSGESYVLFGSTAAFPAIVPLASLYPAGGGDGSRGFVLAGAHAYDFSGFSVSDAGDVNGDDIDDLIVGAPYANDYAGESYVVFGSTHGFPPVVPLARLSAGDGTRGFVLTGAAAYGFSGSAVSAAGDVDGDGIGDLVIGATNVEQNGSRFAGESYVVFGRH